MRYGRGDLIALLSCWRASTYDASVQRGTGGESEQSPYSLEQMRENHASLVARYPPHLRPVGVYEAPPTKYSAVNWEEVEKTHFDPNADFSSVSLVWTAVRGTMFVDAATVPLPFYTRLKVMFELAPEWSNPHDSSAVAIQLHGVRVGYVRARSSWKVYEFVSQLNGLGLQVLLPGEYHADYDSGTCTLVPQSWIVMPTWHHWEVVTERAKHAYSRNTPTASQMPRWESELMKVWEAIDESVREGIAKRNYAPILEHAREFIQYRDRAPGCRLPEQLDRFEPIPATLFWFLQRRRLEQRGREQEIRRELLEEAVKLWREGWTQSDAASELGLSPSAVGKAVRSAVDVDFDETKFEEVGALWRDGWSKGMISRRLMLSASAVATAVKRLEEKNHSD